MPYVRGTLQERFSDKVRKTDTCWVWTGAGAGRYYGQIRLGGKGTPMVYVHRLAYEFVNGPIPEGHEIDHLCRVGRCVRPDHLEAVTPEENNRRRIGFRRMPRYLGETCKAGHPRNPNTFIDSNGARACRLCHREAVRRCKAANKGGVPSLTIA